MCDKISGIYTISNQKNGKQYVGQSCDIKRRFAAHKNKLAARTHSNAHLQAAWDMYGAEAFSFDVVEFCENDELNEKETLWIKRLKTFTPEGYNLTLGGDGIRGYHLSEASRVRLRDSAKRSAARYWLGKRLSAKHKEKLRTAALNRSEETKRKIGEATRRTMANPEIKAKMIQGQNNKAVYCEELGISFYSIGEAARQTGISGGNISKVCRGVIKATGGYHWKFIDAQEAHPGTKGGEVNEYHN